MAQLMERIQILAEILTARQQRLVTAESCTGGGIAQSLTAVAGSSNWFECGFVTYSNEAKMRYLDVSDRTLEVHGAVSEATVIEMVRGAVDNSFGDVAVAVSGIAGPGGGTETKPVGTVWLAWGNAEHQQAEHFHFSGDRDAVRQQSVEQAIIGLCRWLSS